eukprot:gene20506-26277_t
MTLTNNVTDYAAYAEYIGRIISMSDTTGNDSRRYSCLVGTWQLYRKLDAPRNEFHEAKKFAIAGLVTAEQPAAQASFPVTGLVLVPG